MSTAPSRQWRPVAGIAGCVLLLWFSIVRGTRVPLLGLVDLGFHELGHLLAYPLPDVVTAAMGSIAQVAVPIGLATSFAVARRDAVASGLCLAWAGSSGCDVAVYVADAPFERLELIGGEHDWAFILGSEHLDALAAAGTIAAVIRFLGLLLLLGGALACAWELRPGGAARHARPAAPSALTPSAHGFGGRGGI